MNLIEGLKRIAAGGQTESGCVFIDVDDLNEAIAALESMPQWVRCSDASPREFEDLLISDGENVGEGIYSDFGKYKWASGLPARADQWMYMPKPPTP